MWDEKYHNLVYKDDKSINLVFDEESPEGKYKTKFWIPMKSRDRNNPEDLKEQGAILISVQLFTKHE
jgi:hypothetical protein